MMNMTNKTQRLLILDCDGIREPLNGGKFIQHPHDQKIIDGADEAIRLFAKHGWRIVAINQGAVKHSLEDCIIEEQRYTLQLFPELEAVYFCPNPNPGFNCYKVSRGRESQEQEYMCNSEDKSGMLQLVCAEYQPKEIVIYVGDQPEDEQAAIVFMASKSKNFHFEFHPAKDWIAAPEAIEEGDIPF